MKNITIFLLTEEKITDDSIEFVHYEESTFLNDLSKVQGKYISFIKNIDEIEESFFDRIKQKCLEEFDSCFINYTLKYENKILSKEELEEPEIIKKPYQGDYIWSYIWKKEKLQLLLATEEPTNDMIDELFQTITYIREPLILHKLGQEKLLKNKIYTDEKEEIRRTNIIYVGNFCNGVFNGYVSWIKNIGKCFGNDYKITVLCDEIYEPTKIEFEKYVEVIQRQENTNYICDKLLVTYSTYYYPKNILHLEDNYLFIHGNMSDYEHARKYCYNNYSKYIAVSKISAQKAKGFFPVDTIDYLYNPIKIETSELQPHLKLISAQRNDNIKKENRIHIIANILEEENIPYTWSIFTDYNSNERDVYGGIIYRPCVKNPLPYIQDADYYVQLSDSEAYSYSVLEALTLNTKIIVTPLECYEEMHIDEKQAVVIPFELFEPNHKEELREVIKKAYHNKDQIMHNKLSDSMFENYKNILKK